MEGQCTRPALSSKNRGKYGRRDYNRFDNVTSTHMRAGRGNIGKVEVDCRFMFTKSRWGVMGERRDPAGILYLDLDFSQPPDCRLDSATITVTLTEDDGEEGEIMKRSDCPVQFTDHYGPKSVRGPESQVQTRKVTNRTPEVQLFGYGAGGLGQNKEKVVQTRGRWDFSGFISSTKDSVWYNKLRWELKENSLEWQPSHNNLFHTAFAIQHNATRFYMMVHVSGKLARRSDRIKGRLKFGEKGGKDQEIVTKIEWAEGYSCPSRLDETAQYLHEAMGMANMTKVAVEMPSALPASYHPAVINNSQASAAVLTPTAIAITPAPQHSQLFLPGLQQTVYRQHGEQQPVTRAWLAPGLPPARVGDEGSSVMGDSTEDLPMVTLQDLRTATASFTPPPELPRGPPPVPSPKPQHDPAPGPPSIPPPEPRLPGPPPHGSPHEPARPPGLAPLVTSPERPASEVEVEAEEGSETSSGSLTLVNSTVGTTRAERDECLASEADADADADTWQDDSAGEEEQETGSRGVEADGAGGSGSGAGTESKGGREGRLGAIGMRLPWLRMAGMFLLWLAAVAVGGLLETGWREEERDSTRKPKKGGRRRASTCTDAASESSPTKIKLDNARRGRLRGRRGRRPSWRGVEGGGRKAGAKKDASLAGSEWTGERGSNRIPTKYSAR